MFLSPVSKPLAPGMSELAQAQAAMLEAVPAAQRPSYGMVSTTWPRCTTTLTSLLVHMVTHAPRHPRHQLSHSRRFCWRTENTALVDALRIPQATLRHNPFMMPVNLTTRKAELRRAGKLRGPAASPRMAWQEVKTWEMEPTETHSDHSCSLCPLLPPHCTTDWLVDCQRPPRGPAPRCCRAGLVAA